MPNIRTMLDLSTAHLPEHLGQRLSQAPGVLAYEIAYGAVMWVPDDPGTFSNDTDEPVAAEVLAVQRHARQLGCDFVLFDRDADIDDQLPTWNW